MDERTDEAAAAGPYGGAPAEPGGALRLLPPSAVQSRARALVRVGEHLRPGEHVEASVVVRGARPVPAAVRLPAVFLATVSLFRAAAHGSTGSGWPLVLGLVAVAGIVIVLLAVLRTVRRRGGEVAAGLGLLRVPSAPLTIVVTSLRVLAFHGKDKAPLATWEAGAIELVPASQGPSVGSTAFSAPVACSRPGGAVVRLWTSDLASWNEAARVAALAPPRQVPAMKQVSDAASSLVVGALALALAAVIAAPVRAAVGAPPLVPYVTLGLGAMFVLIGASVFAARGALGGAGRPARVLLAALVCGGSLGVAWAGAARKPLSASPCADLVTSAAVGGTRSVRIVHVPCGGPHDAREVPGVEGGCPTGARRLTDAKHHLRCFSTGS